MGPCASLPGYAANTNGSAFAGAFWGLSPSQALKFSQTAAPLHRKRRFRIKAEIHLGPSFVRRAFLRFISEPLWQKRPDPCTQGEPGSQTKEDAGRFRCASRIIPPEPILVVGGLGGHVWAGAAACPRLQKEDCNRIRCYSPPRGRVGNPGFYLVPKIRSPASPRPGTI